MRAQLFPVLLAFILTSGQSLGQAVTKTDQEILQGIWKPIQQLPIAIPDIRYVRLEFKGDKLTWHSRLDEQVGKAETKFKIDQKANPKTIDFTPTDGGNKDQTYVGIYEVKGGVLRIAYRGPGATRPKDFLDKADGNNATTFLTLKPPDEA